MKAYLIIFVIVFSIAAISCVINSISEKKNKNCLTFEISNLVMNGFGIISVFMFFGGLFCIFC